jgi:sec-independent protein translocase protein TatB
MLPGGRGGEFIIVAAIALIVVGPKDLPKMLRQLGRFVGKMRAMADDFKASFEDMARQSELDELRKEVEAMRSQSATGVLGDVKSEMQSLDADLRGHLAINAPEVVTAQPENPQPVNPQLDGHPPARPRDRALMPHPVEPEASGPVPEAAEPQARKPRKARAKADVKADPAEPADVVVKTPRRRKGAS